MGLSSILVIQPIKAYSLTFISDGTSLSASFDLSLLPISEDFRGCLPVEIKQPQITNLPVGVTFTTVLAGTTVTFTFSAALPEFDINSILVQYVATFMLAFGD